MKNEKMISVDLTFAITIVLIALRLDRIITWPWLIVLSPIITANVIKLIMIIVIMIRRR